MKNLLKISLSTFLLSTLAYSQTTMCFKENHKDLTTIESVKLDGGECQSKYSLIQMKENGWQVEDIKINNNSYIYILKKGQISSSFSNNNVSDAELEKRVIAKIEKKQEQEKKEKEIEIKLKNIEKAKNIYVEKCQSCHGEKAQLSPGLSTSLNTLTVEEFTNAFEGYRKGNYSKGNPTLMKAYANTTSVEEVKIIFDYIQSIK